jgi:L-alanine-DL-glutamate epimerase-like enolase superfamily enzyme
MARVTLDARSETLLLKAPFRISGHVFETSDVVVVTLREGDLTGRGEGCGVYYLGDDAVHMREEIEAARNAIESGVTREELRGIMPPGGGRNAVDCALWELEAQRASDSAWALAGQPEPRPLLTTFT